jgi:hypothetical protein
LRASVLHVAMMLDRRRWGPLSLAFDGMETVTVGDDRGRDDVVVLRDDPLAFVLAATGRARPEALGLDPSVNIYA